MVWRSASISELRRALLPPFTYSGGQYEAIVEFRTGLRFSGLGGPFNYFPARIANTIRIDPSKNAARDNGNQPSRLSVIQDRPTQPPLTMAPATHTHRGERFRSPHAISRTGSLLSSIH